MSERNNNVINTSSMSIVVRSLIMIIAVFGVIFSLFIGVSQPFGSSSYLAATLLAFASAVTVLINAYLEYQIVYALKVAAWIRDHHFDPLSR